MDLVTYESHDGKPDFALVKEQRSEFFEMSPRNQVQHASELASVMSDVVEKQKLYSVISGKKYLKAEAWQTLGTLLGIISKERSVQRLPDGSYEAYVDLIKYKDGTIIGGASALCSRSEKRWANADEYAIRSMAVTRAIGKSYRTTCAWIVTLAGYAPTPEEEMPVLEVPANQKNEPPVNKNVTKPNKLPYDPNNTTHNSILADVLKNKNIPNMYWKEINEGMRGKAFDDLMAVVKSVINK
jgi:hypothetical protein